MYPFIRVTNFIVFFFSLFTSFGQSNNRYQAIYAGTPWLDNNGNVVSAHGACIVQEGSHFYLFGEKHSDTSNAFAGFNCYSSTDLMNWTFESTALPVQANGKLGPNRVGERVKVMKCFKSGEFIMYMHVDSLDYKDQFVGYATAHNITGPYTFKGPLLFNGKPIRKWDMGVFQDIDSAGYIALHGGDIYKLSDDYTSVVDHVCNSFDKALEAPTLFRKDSIYFFMGSQLTSWEKNDNYYFTATSLSGPWKAQGLFAPKDALTWNAQSTYVLPIHGSKKTTYMFMGDRWSFPKQYSAATYVWQPLQVNADKIAIPNFFAAWQVNVANGKMNLYKIKGQSITIPSDKVEVAKGASFEQSFTGQQIALYSLSCPEGGYAKIEIKNSNHQSILSFMVDMYCKYPSHDLKFMSPILPKDAYTLVVTNIGERGNWSDKRKSNYGSTGYFVSVEKLVVR